MNISTRVGLNFPQEPTSVEDIHICYLQYTNYNIYSPEVGNETRFASS